MKSVHEVVTAEGHLIDSGIMSKILDAVVQHGGEFEVVEFKMGQTNDDPSVLKLKVGAAEGGPEGGHEGGPGGDPCGRVLELTAREVTHTEAPYDLVRKMRASVLVLGPLLARAGHAEVSLLPLPWCSVRRSFGCCSTATGSTWRGSRPG